MTALAILFLVLVVLRGWFWVFDWGFGGPIRTAIMYVSTFAWAVGFIMALQILFGVDVSVSIHG
jgi:hypothetical protein